MPLTPLGLLNFLLLQWVFVRLAKIFDQKTGKTIGYALLWPVVPMTGWWSDYVGRAKPVMSWRFSSSPSEEKK